MNPVLFHETPDMPEGLKVELKQIEDALLQVDFQINDDDKQEFYSYVLNEIFNTGLEYENPDFIPKKYFKVLLKQIKKIIKID